ncbi:hypothetical protein [Thomasclavelia ramosa]|uniref:hypothetical protein n=1 Tax=Thomasclavelia ramosa TaxID=1547 RepID=UPI001D07D01F|nr:hypothetical protein [Thomasclavelia ramosa]MCB6436550.1 hypothetical protein [Thomasclavelia ramosa]MCB6459557.1 hypothetical protein [Thomasclavelia ramosa]MCB6598874.1 hypothetical protein [Thomasclavelia ramosa]MCB6601406.1 hypothetical protein [Thomasclavelia ramosa]MCB6620641.1 hypothetical protein [Thomasclavelia ramosa]
MLKIEKIKEKIKNFDTVNSGEDLQCYLSRIATNQNYDDTCYRIGIDCSDCLKLSLMDLLKEYKGTVKLSKFEYEYLKFAKENGYNFIARDKNNNLYLYSNKPWKAENDWDYEDRTTPVFAELFKFVKWENESPMLIEELLKCEVIENE